jgi:antitoxin VapB
MTINIKDADTDAKARELARLTGEGLTKAVRIAIEQRLARESMRGRAGIAQQLLSLGERLVQGRRLFAGTAEEAIGYDEQGLSR